MKKLRKSTSKYKINFTMHSLTIGTVRPIYSKGVPLPSRHPILYIFSTNPSTEYFKHAAHSLFFPRKMPFIS